ncbi:MAG TPA: hypothetical protein PLZ84_05770, partial [Clostridia bacterium]|nr:hypothetical protein [Clostridia bacterium]
AVSRRLYRSGESLYLLNNNQCRLKDIVRLFQDTGIGKEGYSVIGQGRIDEILSSRSEDRRAVLEEAAGIVKYRTSKDEAQRRLEHTENNLIRINDILQELENRTEPLKEQSEIAHMYLSLRESLRDLEVNLFIYQYDNLEQKKAKLLTQIQSLDDEKEFKHKEIEALTQQNSALDEELNKKSQELDHISKKRVDLVYNAEKNQGLKGIVEERILHLTKENERILTEIAAIESAAASLEASEKQDKELAAGLDMRLGESISAIADMEKQLKETTDAMAEKEARFEQLKNNMIAEMNRLSDVRSGLSRLEAMRGTLKARFDEIDAGIVTSEHEFTVKKAAVDETGKQLESLQQALADITSKRDKHLRILEDLGRERTAVQSRINETSNEKQAVATRLNMLYELKREYEGFNASVKNLLNAARQGAQLSGICGALATLIRVPENLETAIEAVLGARIQNIVTETDIDAKRAIEYLKANNLGRATFLPISAIKGRSLTKDERECLDANCLGVASELIEYDQKYKGIIENLLGRTVIVKDLDSAIMVARRAAHSFCLVTPDGDVINPGGSMSGGSMRTNSSTLLSRDRVITSLEKKAAELDSAIMSHKDMSRQLEEKMERAKSEHLAYEGKVKEAADAVNECKEKYAKIHAVYESAEQRYNELRLEKERLEETLADILEQITRIESEHNDVSLQSTTAQKDINDAQQELALARAERDRIADRLNELRIEHGALVREQKSLSEKLAKDAKERQELAKQKEKKLLEVMDITRQIDTSQEQIAEALAASGQYEADIKQLQTEEENLLNVINGLKQAKKDAEEKKDALKADIDSVLERRYKSELSIQ